MSEPGGHGPGRGGSYRGGRQQPDHLDRDDVHQLREVLKKVLDVFENRIHQVDAAGFDLKAELMSLGKLVRGNGVEGLVTKINIVMEQIKHIDERLTALERGQQKVLWWVIGILSSALGAMVMTFVISKLARP